MRLRSGCVMLFSGLPSPMPSLHGRSYCSPWNSTGSSRAIAWRKIWIHSRVRSSGFVNGCPYQPSTTCGPDTPTPRISRPLEMWSSVSAVIAAQVGVRAEICITPVPSRIRFVEAAIAASGVKQSDP